MLGDQLPVHGVFDGSTGWRGGVPFELEQDALWGGAGGAAEVVHEVAAVAAVV